MKFYKKATTKLNFSSFIHCSKFQFFVWVNDAHTQKFKKLKICLNTFHPVDSFFLISKLIILINFSLYILWIRIYEFSPLQCLVLFLISSQERTNINCIKKQTSKNIFYSKSKLNQAFVLALPDWQLLCQVSENAILLLTIYWYLENYSIVTS